MSGHIVSRKKRVLNIWKRTILETPSALVGTRPTRMFRVRKETSSRGLFTLVSEIVPKRINFDNAYNYWSILHERTFGGLERACGIFHDHGFLVQFQKHLKPL